VNNPEPLKAPEPKQIAEFKSDRQLIASRFSPDGSILATTGYEPQVQRWQFDGKQLTPLPALDGFTGWTTAVAFHPKQPLLFASDSWGQLRCQPFTGDAPKPVWKNDTAHDGWIRQLAISPDGSRIATCGRDQALRVWQSDSGKLIAEHKGTHDIFAITFDPAGSTIVFGDLHGSLKTWDFGANKIVRTYAEAKLHNLSRLQDLCGLRVLLFIDGGKTLVAAGTLPAGGGTPQSTPTILFFDSASGKLTKTIAHGTTKDGFVHDLALHPSGYLMAVTSGTPGSGMLLFVRPQDKEPFHVNTKMANCHTVALHPDGNHFIVSSTNRDSQGNGKTLAKDGSYKTNSSPLHLFQIGEPAVTPASEIELPDPDAKGPGKLKPKKAAS